MCRGGSADEERRSQVDVEDPVPVVDGFAGGWAEVGGSGAVDDDIDGSVTGDDVVDEACSLVGVGEVGDVR